MKASRLLLTASVIGAVAIGGAVTGATLASFSGSAPLSPDTLQTGSLSLATTSATGSIEDLAPGGSADVSVTLTEEAEGKNLFTQRIVDDVAVTGYPADALKIEFREGGPNDRSACTSNGFKDWSKDAEGQGQQRHLVLRDPGKPTPTSEVCIRVTLEESARSLLGVGITSGGVQVTFTSQQVQGKKAVGWESSAAPVTIPVVSTILPMSPEDVDCDIFDFFGPMLRVSWSTVSDVQKYRLSRLWNDGGRRSFDMAPTLPVKGRTHWVAPLSSLLTDRDQALIPDGQADDWGNRLVIQAGQGEFWSADSVTLTVDYDTGKQKFACQ